MNRRDFIQSTALAAGAIALGPNLCAESPAPQEVFTLPKLPYPFEALEPHIDAETMRIHHGKHHAAYIKNANAALAKAPELARLDVESLLRRLGDAPEEIRVTLRNNAGGHANHALFWKLLSPTPQKEPSGALADAIKGTFGSLETFRSAFTESAMQVFGSGWTWLSLDAAGTLQIESTPNQDSPLMSGRTPLLGLDVWEHAYYLKYQNRRAEYIAAFWNVLDWKGVAAEFARAKQS